MITFACDGFLIKFSASLNEIFPCAVFSFITMIVLLLACGPLRAGLNWAIVGTELGCH